MNSESFASCSGWLSRTRGQWTPKRSAGTPCTIFHAATRFADTGRALARHVNDISGVAGVTFVLEPVQLLERAAVAKFLLKLEMLTERPSLIVLDTLARCLDGADENSAKDMGSAIAASQFIQQTTGATVLLVHHTRKDGESERGSGALRGSMDAMLAIKREAGDSRLTVQCEKMKDAPHFASFALDFHQVHSTDSGALITAKGPLQLRTGELTGMQRSALDALQRSALDDGLTTTQWLSVSGVGERSFYAVVKALVTVGYVTKSTAGRGARHTVSSDGMEALSR